LDGPVVVTVTEVVGGELDGGKIGVQVQNVKHDYAVEKAVIII